MWETQKKFEETVTVLNEGYATRGSGGVALITNGTSTSIKMLMLPDTDVFVEKREEDNYRWETLYAQIRKTEMDKVNMIPGQTRVVWNGNDYKVLEIIDYRNKNLFRLAEIRLARRLDVI